MVKRKVKMFLQSGSLFFGVWEVIKKNVTNIYKYFSLLRISPGFFKKMLEVYSSLWMGLLERGNTGEQILQTLFSLSWGCCMHGDANYYIYELISINHLSRKDG